MCDGISDGLAELTSLVIQYRRRFVTNYCIASLHSLTSFLGIRISLYNAVTEDQTDQVVAYMDDFLAEAKA